MDPILFSEPYRTGREAEYLEQALASDHWTGDGSFTKAATKWLSDYTGVPNVLLTTSCTHALDMAAILLQIGPGDEVIVPSFTFSSTATAIALRGATPVFVDILPDTLNIDPAAAAAAITENTKAIFIVHYGGIAADLPALLALCAKHDLALVEDNAHSLGAYWQGRHLGTFGTFATQSFHDTKNVTSGEGGALLTNDPEYAERAEIIREKGTNRSRFLRGQVDKYTWVDQGSSYLPSDLLAALLLAQLESFDEIQGKRQLVWHAYRDSLGDWARNLGVEIMHVPDDCVQPAHLFYLMLPSHEQQQAFLTYLRANGVIGTFHYQPLDSSPAGKEFGRTPNPCVVTADRALRLARLPLHAGLADGRYQRVIETVLAYRG